MYLEGESGRSNHVLVEEGLAGTLAPLDPASATNHEPVRRGVLCELLYLSSYHDPAAPLA